LALDDIPEPARDFDLPIVARALAERTKRGVIAEQARVKIGLSACRTICFVCPLDPRQNSHFHIFNLVRSGAPVAGERSSAESLDKT